MCESQRHDNRSIVIAVTLPTLLIFMVATSILFSKSLQAKTPAADRVLNINTGIWYPTIQSAVDAPATTHGHTLSLTQGIYLESVVIPKSLTLIGSEPLSTVLDGNNLGRVISVTAGVNANITNVTIQNGLVSDGSNGGGISNQGILTLTNSYVMHNWVSFFGNIPGGGGIYNVGTLNIISSTIKQNSAAGVDDIGLGVANLGTLKIMNSSVSQNESNVSPPPGSGIYNGGVATLIGVIVDHNEGTGIQNQADGVLSLYNSIITNNTGEVVGGIHNKGFMTITTSFVTANSAGLAGSTAYREAGGIFNDYILTVISSTISGNTSCETGSGVYNTGILMIDSSTVSDNKNFCSPSIGGAGITNDGDVLVTNSTLSRNTSGSGGGLLAHFGTVELNNVTIADNVAQQTGGGISLISGTLTIQNTIVARNTGGLSPDCTGSIFSQGHNLIGASDGCAFVPQPSDIVGTIDHPIDPLLGPLGNFGGYNSTIGLIPGSPAIDAGNPATCPSVDQRGFTRQGVCDIGSYEFGIGPSVLLGFLPAVYK
ncbi:hypothetical protein TFLX_02182 [Thermoflexales bacterium]|nr:hypothetical protein TFLX_02182 [Thermoflexales bacterium]